MTRREFAATLAAATGTEANTHSFPLRVAKNRRHLVDQSGAPFLYHADAPWHLLYRPALEEIREYLENRRRKHFNTLQVQLLVDGDPYPSKEGGEPFATRRDLSTPNPPFFDHVDRVLKLCGSYGMQVALAPAWLGCCRGGWRDVLLENGPVKVRVFGQWLGRRYRRVPHLMWLLGGDRDPGKYLEVVRALALGIREGGAGHLMMAHAGSPVSAAEVYGGERWLDVNTTYTYEPDTRGVGRPQYHVYRAALVDYLRRPVRPFILLESAYENERNATPQRLRQQAYWALLSGACGHAMGNAPMYQFERGWRQALDSRLSWDMSHLYGLFSSRPWHRLVPDPEHFWITGGTGTYSDTTEPERGNDYATVAASQDGRLLMAYLPTPRPVTLNLKRLDPRAEARWFDPSSGAYLQEDVQAVLRPPGRNAAGDRDWVLVVERS
ncbi:MAG: DUF4038 domain-containing protein [Bryobacteraceae bacterium]|nr:DUF4038 domain-containing protein [Bryobacteraceae bacterium]